MLENARGNLMKHYIERVIEQLERIASALELIADRLRYIH